MYNPNNQLKQPDIYAILNTEDPAIEGPIDTDALVKDIFDTNYSTSNEFNFNHGKKYKTTKKNIPILTL
jgi:hypothetical protein